MLDRPILFSGPMVRAIIEGRKTQTRRILKPQPEVASALGIQYWTHPKFPGGYPAEVLKTKANRLGIASYAPGDRLWVRESCRGEELTDGQDGVRFLADDTFQPIANTPDAAINWLKLHTYRQHENGLVGPWVSSIHMPRWASRITLLVEAVKVERLQDISSADTIAEGFQCATCQGMNKSACSGLGCFASRQAFRTLWESINGPDSWEENPWVSVIEFQPIFQNIDIIRKEAA